MGFILRGNNFLKKEKFSGFFKNSGNYKENQHFRADQSHGRPLARCGGLVRKSHSLQGKRENPWKNEGFARFLALLAQVRIIGGNSFQEKEQFFLFLQKPKNYKEIQRFEAYELNGRPPAHHGVFLCASRIPYKENVKTI